MHPFQQMETNIEQGIEGESPASEKTKLSRKAISEKVIIQNKLNFSNVNDEIDYIISDYLEKVFSDKCLTIEKDRLQIEEELNNTIMQEKFLEFIKQIKLPQKLASSNSVNELTNIIKCFLNSNFYKKLNFFQISIQFN